MMRVSFLLLSLIVIFSCSDNDIDNSTEKESSVQSTIQASGELVSSDNTIISTPQAKGIWRHKITFMAPEGRMIKEGKHLIVFD